jgi:hypothetical protein
MGNSNSIKFLVKFEKSALIFITLQQVCREVTVNRMWDFVRVEQFQDVKWRYYRR